MNKRRNNKGMLSSILCCFIIATSVCTANASVKRPYAGESRYDTAIKIVEDGWKTADIGILSAAKNANLVDALTAAPLAYKLKAPIFLTDGENLDSATSNKIKALQIKTIYITSGEGVISKGIEAKLKGLGIQNIVRLGGKNRYESAVNVANILEANGKIMVARADEYADALSAAGIAAKQGIPILLADQEGLPEETKNFIKGQRIDTSYVLGLSGALGSGVYDALPHPKRLGGNNRYETNIEIIKEFEDSLNFDKMFVASGESANLVDVLAGSPLAAQESAPIVLVPSELGDNTSDYISRMLNPGSDIRIFGGLGAVPQNISDSLESVQRNLSTTVVKGEGSVKESLAPLFKEIQIKAEGIKGATKFRVEGSSQTAELGKSIVMLAPQDTLVVYLYSSDNKVIARGELNVAEPGEHKSITFKIVK